LLGAVRRTEQAAQIQKVNARLEVSNSAQLTANELSGAGLVYSRVLLATVSSELARSSDPVREASAPPGKSKKDLEKLNAVPFSGVVGVERCVLHPNPVAGRRPGIEHLKRVTAGTKGFWKRALDLCPFGNRGRFLNRAHWLLPTDGCSVFLRGNGRHQRG